MLLSGGRWGQLSSGYLQNVTLANMRWKPLSTKAVCESRPAAPPLSIVSAVQCCHRHAGIRFRGVGPTAPPWLQGFKGKSSPKLPTTPIHRSNFPAFALASPCPNPTAQSKPRISTSAGVKGNCPWHCSIFFPIQFWTRSAASRWKLWSPVPHLHTASTKGTTF